MTIKIDKNAWHYKYYEIGSFYQYFHFNSFGDIPMKFDAEYIFDYYYYVIRGLFKSLFFIYLPARISKLLEPFRIEVDKK